MGRTRPESTELCIIANRVGQTRAPLLSIVEVQTDIAGPERFKFKWVGVRSTTQLRKERVGLSDSSLSSQSRASISLITRPT